MKGEKIDSDWEEKTRIFLFSCFLYKIDYK